MNDIEAKLTMHEHILFRSRLEVKWAKLFQAIGITSIYEPCTIKTKQGCYVPDFYLPSLNTWVEVKPKKPSETELSKFIEICVKHQEFGLLVQNYPKSYPRGVEPHVANCNIQVVFPNGINFKLSADEFYQIGIKNRPGMEWVFHPIITKSNEYTGGYLPPIHEYIRVINIEPARKTILRERRNRHILGSLKTIRQVFKELYRRQEVRGAA